MKLKKNIAMLLASLSLISIFVAFASATKIALAAEPIPTSIVSPSSYVEYRTLVDPEDIFVRGKKGTPEYLVVIAEKQKIHIYRNDLYQTVDLTDYSVTRVVVWQDFVLFLSASEIYSFKIPQDGSSPTITSTGGIAASYFILTENDCVIANPSGCIRRYYPSFDDNGVKLNYSPITDETPVVGQTPSCLTSYDGKLYYFSETKLCRVEGQGRVELCDVSFPPRSATVVDGTLYYSNEKGVFSVKLAVSSTYAVETVCSSSSNLSNVSLNQNCVYSPKGIFVCDGLLYICDEALDAVVTYDIAAKSLTDFAICDRGELKNRISHHPLSVTATDDEVFFLDEDKIKVYDAKTLSFSAYDEAAIIGSDKIAATKYEKKTFLLTASGKDLKLFEKSSDGLVSRKIVGNEVFQFIQAVCAADKYFYFVNNTTNGAILYRLNAETGAIEKKSAIKGVGQLLCSDVFGKIYMTVHTDNDYVIYGGDAGMLDEKPIATFTKKPLSQFCDVEDNLFVLFDGNVVTKISNGQSTDFTLDVSKNLPGYNAISSCLIPATDRAFFLYGGFVLTTQSLPIKTPQDVPVPENYDISLNESPSKAVIRGGAKVFLIRLTNDKTAQTFSYDGYESEKTEKEYFVIGSDDRYYILTDGSRSVAVRKSDATEKEAEVKDSSSVYFAVADQNAYSYPLVSDLFRLFDIKKNEKLIRLKTVVVNGKEYTLVQKGEQKGYVASTLLKSAIAADTSPVDFYTTTVCKEGAIIYADKDLTQKVGEFASYQKIRIYGKEGNAYLVSFDGKTCYISVASVKPRGYYAIRYLLVVVVLVVALFSTGYYLVKTRVFKKKNEDE